MPEIGGGLPTSVRERARFETFACVPALVVHPSFAPDAEGAVTRAPVLFWMHGRTANKELDPGRFLRLVRAGIATVSLDLPGHGAREMAVEIDSVVEAALATGWFDDTRLAIGGMSAGGMATLIRLCRAHTFRAACVECTTGSFAWQRNRAMFEPQRAARLDPIQHLDAWRAIPLLVLHNTLDAWVAVEGQREFVETLRARGLAREVVMHEFGETGAPHEHSGFGRFAAEAKDRQTEFLVRHVRDS
jgi:alpha-beta hydrolase superfamily lysophospholipase